MKSSIIDVPRRHDQDDLFGIKVYQDALIDYVKYTDTPITIALQGEWGSGKTSLMNLLRWNLCDMSDAPYFPIWIYSARSKFCYIFSRKHFFKHFLRYKFKASAVYICI